MCLPVYLSVCVSACVCLVPVGLCRQVRRITSPTRPALLLLASCSRTPIRSKDCGNAANWLELRLGSYSPNLTGVATYSGFCGPIWDDYLYKKGDFNQPIKSLKVTRVVEVTEWRKESKSQICQRGYPQMIRPSAKNTVTLEDIQRRTV